MYAIRNKKTGEWFSREPWAGCDSTRGEFWVGIEGKAELLQVMYSLRNELYYNDLEIVELKEVE